MRLGLVALMMFAFTSCLDLGTDGSDTVLQVCLNSERNRKAILFKRIAGATVPDSYQVSVMKQNSSFDTTEVGNTFSVIGNHEKASLNSKSVHLKWVNEGNLEIYFNKNLIPCMQNKKVNDVTITYQALVE